MPHAVCHYSFGIKPYTQIRLNLLPAVISCILWHGNSVQSVFSVFSPRLLIFMSLHLDVISIHNAITQWLAQWGFSINSCKNLLTILSWNLCFWMSLILSKLEKKKLDVCFSVIYFICCWHDIHRKQLTHCRVCGRVVSLNLNTIVLTSSPPQNRPDSWSILRRNSSNKLWIICENRQDNAGKSPPLRRLDMVPKCLSRELKWPFLVKKVQCLFCPEGPFKAITTKFKPEDLWKSMQEHRMRCNEKLHKTWLVEVVPPVRGCRLKEGEKVKESQKERGEGTWQKVWCSFLNQTVTVVVPVVSIRFLMPFSPPALHVLCLCHYL